MKIKININRSLRTCTIAIILFALLFSTILTIPSFNVLAQNQTAASLNETGTEAAIGIGNETDVEDGTTPEIEPEEIISLNKASLTTDKSTYSPSESVSISLLYVPPSTTVNLTIISPDDIVYIALPQENGVYSFTETTAIGTYHISANLSFARELETETETKTQTLTLTKEFEVVGEEGKLIDEERGFDLNSASLSVDKTTYALGETVRICLAVAPEVINTFSIINPAGIFYTILPSASGEYEFKPDSTGNYVINVSLRADDDAEKVLILTAEFTVMDLGLEILFEEPEQGEIVVGEPVNWTQHISITNHGNVSLSNYALTIPLPADYSNLSSDADAPITYNLSPLTSTLISVDLAPGENASFNIFYQTSPVKLEVVEASIDISDLIPSDAFDVGVYKQIETGEELKEVSSPSLTESEVKVKQVTVTHNSSVHYHNIPVCIEAEAEEDTKVVELVNGMEKEIESEISDKNASWIVPELSNRTFMITKRELIPEQAKAEIDKPVEWQLNVSGTIIKYKTTAPFKNESAPRIENGTWKKEITIGSIASVHYSNVTAFTSINETKGADIKLFLIENSSRIDVTNNPIYEVTFVDADENGLTDKVLWNVPCLSNKTFEVEQRIEVINVQSYPTVGGNWTVAFNTTGKADLTITAVNGTTWSNQNEENDLKFLEVRHGEGVLDYEWIDESCSVLIRNFSSDETNFEVSKVLTTGKHTLQFRFGDDIEYAYNYAVNETEGWWRDTFLDESGIAEKHNVNVGDGDVKLSRISSTWIQTTQADFEAGVLNQVDTALSPGDVKLAVIATGPILITSDNSEGSVVGDTDWHLVKTLTFTKSGVGYNELRIDSDLKATTPATAYSKIEVDDVEQFNHSTDSTSYVSYSDVLDFSSYPDGTHTIKLYLKTSHSAKAAYNSILRIYQTGPTLITSDNDEISVSGDTEWHLVKTLTFTKSGSGYDDLTIESDLKATSPKTAYSRIDVDDVEKFSHSTESTSYESYKDFLDFSSYPDGTHTVKLYLKTNSKTHAAYNFAFELYRTTPILEAADNSAVETLDTGWHLVKTLSFTKSGSGYDHMRIDSDLKTTSPSPATAYSKIEVDGVEQFSHLTDSQSFVSYKDFFDFSSYPDGEHTVKLYLKTSDSHKAAYNFAFELYKTGPTMVTADNVEGSVSGDTNWHLLKTLTFTKSGIGYNELTIDSNLKATSPATASSSIRVDDVEQFSHATTSTTYVSYSDTLDFSSYPDGLYTVKLYLKTNDPDKAAYNSIFELHQIMGYASQGTVASKVYDTGASGTNGFQLSWSETLRSGTNITFEARASDTLFAKNSTEPSWIDFVAANSPVTSGLPSGQYMQWRATLKTEDTSKTPILHEVSIIYSYQDYQESGNLTSIEITPSTLASWDKFYANTTAPSGTSITFSILNAANSTLISEISPTEAKNGYDISSISESSIRLYASLNTTDISNTPVLHDWNVSWSTDATAPTITIDTPTTSSPVYRRGGEQFWVNFAYTEDNPKNYTVEIRNSTNVINTTENESVVGGSNKVANESFSLNSTAADGKYNVSVKMYDTSSNSYTAYQNYSVVKDEVPPTWQNQGSNTTTPLAGASVLLYAQGKDNVGLNYAVLATNESGAWENITDGRYGSPMDMGAATDWTWSNFTWQNASITAGTTVGWRIWYNDTAGNTNHTETRTFNILAPDLRVVKVTFEYSGTDEASVSETGTGYHVKEGRNITVNATIANYGLANVTTTFNVSFFDCAGVYGDWSTWLGNYTYNVTEKGQLGNTNTGYPYNTTYAIVYWDPSLVGTHNISAWADPENTLGERASNVTNNNGSALINVSAWQKYWGNVSGNIVLAGSAGDNMSTWDWPAGSVGNLYIVNHSATINWTALRALGYNKTDGATTNDFLDADINLGMNVGSNNATGFTNNNITELFSTGGNGASARNTTSFTVYGKPINHVSIINSTDMTNHTDVENAIVMTGILWDTSDDKDGDGEYDTTDKEDLVFIANIRYYASDIDYKIAIPCALNAAIGGELDFYVELR